MEDNRDDIAGWRTAWLGAQIHIYGCKGRSIYLSLPKRQVWILRAKPAFVALKAAHGLLRPDKGKAEPEIAHETKDTRFLRYGDDPLLSRR